MSDKCQVMRSSLLLDERPRKSANTGGRSRFELQNPSCGSLTLPVVEQVYYVYGFMLLVFLILVIVTVCVTIVGTYFLLNAENYHWQWTSFTAAASTALCAPLPPDLQVADRTLALCKAHLVLLLTHSFVVLLSVTEVAILLGMTGRKNKQLPQKGSRSGTLSHSVAVVSCLRWSLF